MKWNNKGHEYDGMYENISKLTHFYLFGAGDYGRQFLRIFRDEITIDGYIDNSEKKQGTTIEGIPCFSLDNVREKRDIGIIVTMSQIARVEPVEQLKKMGYVRNRDFFIIEEFISVYFAYKKNEVYLSSISFLPSTICNLNCKNCLNFNPYAKQFYMREWDDLVKDVDLFFSCVDKIMLFHVSGGEPMLYKHTAELIQYIDENYGDRIGTLRTVTNGTVVPKEEMLHTLSKCNVEITVDDYREAVPRFNDRFDQLIEKLEEYHIKYYINKAESWIDLAPDRTDYSDRPEEWLINHRDLCNQSWQELRDGKLYSCNYAAYATVAGIAGEQDLEEVYDLTTYTPDKMKELIEFRLGYTTKGYTNFCKKCRGFTPDNTIEETPAEQTTVGM
ncbi:MAG: radical SAM protein [Lachnospiraceae bacterium]|nr:radical SAM protein [Lachnospiraceae bacterium]